MVISNGVNRNGHHDHHEYGGVIDPIVANQRNLLANSAPNLQRQFLTSLVDPRRSIEDECGMPPLGSQVDVNLYRMLYDRDAIANRAVRFMAEECFQVHPKVYDSEEEADEPTPFEKAVDSLGQKLGRDGKSWYKDEEGSVVNEILKRAAILSRIGRFGVLLMGVNDGRNLQEPVAGVITINHKGREVLRHPFSHGWHDSPAAEFNEDAQTWNLLAESSQSFTVTTNTNWRWQAPDSDIDLSNLTSTENIGKIIRQLVNPRPPQLVCDRNIQTVNYRPSHYDREITANTIRLVANHRQLEQEHGRSLTCNEAVSITSQRVENAKQTPQQGRPTGPGGMRGQGGPPYAMGNPPPIGPSIGGPAPYTSAPLPSSQQSSSGGKVGGGQISGTDTQYAAGISPPNYQTSPVSTPPSFKSNNPQYDKSNSWQDHGLGMPPAALSGTDQQYFGVQYGPSEMLSDKPLPSGDKALQLVFLRAYSEDLVQIVRYEWNIFNPRFGLPVMYRITLNDPRDMSSGGVGLPMATVFVHWSRVIHIALERNSSEIFSPPAMQPILNNVLGLHKLYGAGPEMFWKGAFPGFSFETNPQLGGDVLIDVPAMLNMYEQYQNGLQRALVTSGMTVKSMAPAVADPGPQIDKQIEAICIQKQTPKRVFMGTERGELASSQDDEKWNDRVHAYDLTELNPHLIFPFYDRLIQLGIVPEPGTPAPDKDKKLTANSRADVRRMVTQLIVNIHRLTPREFDRQVRWIKRNLERVAANAAVPTPPPAATKVNPFTAPPKPDDKQSNPVRGGSDGPPAAVKGPVADGDAGETSPSTKAGGPSKSDKPPGTPGGPNSKVGSAGLFSQGDDGEGHTHQPLGKTSPIDSQDDEDEEDDKDKVQGYGVEWPSMDSQSQTDKATIALTKTQAIVAYAGGGEPVMPRQYWLTHVMGFTEEETQAIMDDAEHAEQQQQLQAATLADQHGMQPTPPPGFQAKPEPPTPPPGMPGGPPAVPVKVGAGQSLVHPQTGATVAKGPPQPKPPGGK